MINYPDDEKVKVEANLHGIPLNVLIRDIVRIVEVLNLDAQSFFSGESVLSGSMALRSFNTPRFTVYDVDFSTVGEDPVSSSDFASLLKYSDDDLEITPVASVPHDERGTPWKVEPVEFDPIFTDINLSPDDQTFKVDISHRGLVCPGMQRSLRLPYNLSLWADDPIIWIMDPHEIVAEKTLGWCVRRQVKHYADLAFIALMANPKARKRAIDLNGDKLRSVLEAKLETMKQLQPSAYSSFTSVEKLISLLGQPPGFDNKEWRKIVYLKQQRNQFDQPFLENTVRSILIPLFKG